MCYQVKCGKCEKVSWGGCGLHVDSVMKDVPKEKQCQCPRENSGSGCSVM
ncbi:hypothetical protein BC829DRAFT_375934 [Chytridium lagenaria]|nr:hypothetical protein BC829DRAFT_375934 [Chytridium lagenaria]